jgi:hypothetical protein
MSADVSARPRDAAGLSLFPLFSAAFPSRLDGMGLAIDCSQDNSSGKESPMLSQLETPATTPRIATRINEDPSQIDITVTFDEEKKMVFSVATPTDRVTVEDRDTLKVRPGSYFLNFIAVDDAFENPAMVFGPLGIKRTGLSMVTLSNDNTLVPGDKDQIFDFTFNFVSGSHDPTIVNTPDPA